MIRIISFFFLIVLTVEMSCGQSYYLADNIMRHGDILCKIKVPSLSSGIRGDNAIWYFEIPEENSTEHFMEINSRKDSIALFEKYRILHFFSQNDTLYLMGEQGRRSHTILYQRRPLLKYPFISGDGISGIFSGEGRNEDLHYFIEGSGYSIVDGSGSLTDGTDTINNVIRIHLRDNYVLRYDNGEQDSMSEDRYLWYCSGCRYPVMEKIRIKNGHLGDSIAMDSLCYLNLPVMQSDLPYDEENEKIRIENYCMADTMTNSSKGMFESLCASLSDDGQTLNIDYTQTSTSDIVFSVCDLYGNIIAYKCIINQNEGKWHNSIELRRQTIGKTIILIVNCNGQQISLKVSK